MLNDAARHLADEILRNRSDDWWFQNMQDGHWVHRGREEKNAGPFLQNLDFYARVAIAKQFKSG